MNLILTLIIFFLSMMSADAQNVGLPDGSNSVKAYLDDYMQPSLMKSQLYVNDTVDAGGQGMVTRKSLESGVVALFRYGNRKASGGKYPAPGWATSEISRVIKEYLQDGGIDPDIPNEDLSEDDRVLKERLTKEAHKEVGYTVGEQRQFLQTALEQKQKELGRPLTDAEKDQIRTVVLAQYPLKNDLQTDEVEGIAIINNTSIYQVHDIFTRRNDYSTLLPDYFSFSHVLTPDELSIRDIKTTPFEDFLFGQFHIAGMDLEYTDFNKSTLNMTQVQLKTAEGPVTKVIPIIMAAWKLDDRFLEDGAFVPVLDKKTGKIIGHNGKFGPKNILVIDGYLEVSPYIAKDANGNESIDESRVLAVYHTYTRINPKYRDMTGLTDSFREIEGRKFLGKMMAIVRTQ